MLLLDRRTFILVIIILIIAFLLQLIIRIIKWVFHTIRYIFTGNRRREDPVNSQDWLTRAQARQEVRFKNSLPPIRSEARPQKRTLRQRWNLRKGRSETGWIFNEETQLWEPPKNMR